MTFNYESARRATPTRWLERLREMGALLVDKEAEDAVNLARRHLKPEAAADNAKLGAVAREFAFAREWAQSGFPEIVLDDRLFASLAATRVPQELLPEVGLPWPCFVIRVPESLHEPVDWGLGISLPIAYISVRPMGDDPTVACVELKPSDAPGATMSFALRRLADAIDPKLEEADAVVRHDWDAEHGKETGSLFKETPAHDAWVSRNKIDLAMRQAFVGAILELGRRASSGASLPRKHAIKPLRGAPKSWRFKLGRKVVVDARPWLRSVLRGESKRMLSVQVLVRGHWKNQPCGPERSERKFIHVEPYWRGPDDAPIPIRPHLMRAEPPAPAE